MYWNLTANAAPPYFQQTNDCPGVNCAPKLASLPAAVAGNRAPLPTDSGSGARGAQFLYLRRQTPLRLTYTLGVQHVFWNNYTFEARYVGTRGVHLWNQDRHQHPTTGESPTTTFRPSSPCPVLVRWVEYDFGAGQIVHRAWWKLQRIRPTILPFMARKRISSATLRRRYSSYNGLALQLNRRFSNGLAFIAAYTWSHTEDDATATNFSTYLTPRRAQDFQEPHGGLGNVPRLTIGSG